MNAQQRRKAKRKNHYSEIVEQFLAEENKSDLDICLEMKDKYEEIGNNFAEQAMKEFDSKKYLEKVKKDGPPNENSTVEEYGFSGTDSSYLIKQDEQELKESGLFTKIKKFFKGDK